MKSTLLAPIVFLVATVGNVALAAKHDQHTGHHPTEAAGGARSKSVPADMARMDAQTLAMRGMHDKLMAAKTAEERSALMAGHMKAMHDGMAMMSAMPGGDMKGDMKGGMKGGMPMHQMMEKRMEMMGATMQMMMDRLPAVPEK